MHADQGRAFADVVAAAGDDRVAGDRGAVGEAGVEADVADRLLLAAAVGPAMPVIETATSASKRSSAPIAIASATSGETAPLASISAGSTPSSSALASFE